jgi:hypothetical protein
VWVSGTSSPGPSSRFYDENYDENLSRPDRAFLRPGKGTFSWSEAGSRTER